MQSTCLMGTGFPSGVMDIFWRQRWWLYSPVNILNVIKLFPLRRLILYSMNLTSIRNKGWTNLGRSPIHPVFQAVFVPFSSHHEASFHSRLSFSINSPATGLPSVAPTHQTHASLKTLALLFLLPGCSSPRSRPGLALPPHSGGRNEKEQKISHRIG